MSTCATSVGGPGPVKFTRDELKEIDRANFGEVSASLVLAVASVVRRLKGRWSARRSREQSAEVRSS